MNAYRMKDKSERAVWLQQHKLANENFAEEQDTRAQTVAEMCADALLPWSLDDELVVRSREDDLLGLTKYAQGLGLRLFEAREGMAWVWDGEWTSMSTRKGEVVVVVRPGLVVMGGGGRGSAERWEEIVGAKVEGL